MRRTQAARPDRTAAADPDGRAVTSEEVFLRSYDHRRGYDVELRIAPPDGEPAFERRYYLQPGETLSEVDVVPDGEFEASVTMDNGVEETIDCRIGSAPEDTLVVEVGNGAVSLTEGLVG